MNPEIILWIFIFLIIFEFLVSFVLEYLNTTKWWEIPEKLKNIYDETEYKKSMEYEKEKHRFWLIKSVFSTILILVFLSFWIFWKIYDFVFSQTWSEFFANLLFVWILFLGQVLLNIPFSYYWNFVIEEKFWFNKMTKKIFFLDILKSVLLGLVIWWLLFSALLWVYSFFPNNFWLYAWIIIVLFMIFSIMFYQSLISPLFNKQTPLQEWELRDKIEKFAKKEWFKLDNIFVIDWSKRSTKANAYFSGFWPKKRIVLFDTLINDLTTDELVAVLAHEIGHYQEKHILKMLFISIVQTWIILFILWIVLNHLEFWIALWSQTSSLALWIIAFSIVFSPLSMVFEIFWNILSRKHEYEADKYSWVRLNPENLKDALIKLSKNSLTNLAPHPAYEFFYYSHPTILKRIEALEKIKVWQN